MPFFTAFLLHIVTQDKMVDKVEHKHTYSSKKDSVKLKRLGIEIKRKCPICGKVFIIKTLDSIYCSTKCSKVAYKRKKGAEKKEHFSENAHFKYAHLSFLSYKYAQLE